jgi:hypothetical protein
LDEDKKELVAVTAVGLARPTAKGAPVLATGATTRYKWPKPTKIFKGNPDEKLYAIVKQALANTPWSSKLQTKACLGCDRSEHIHTLPRHIHCGNLSHSRASEFKLF